MSSKKKGLGRGLSALFGDEKPKTKPQEINQSNDGEKKITEFSKSIEFDDVSFSYNNSNQKALQNICLKIFKSNNMLGLIIFTNLLIGKLISI